MKIIVIAFLFSYVAVDGIQEGPPPSSANYDPEFFRENELLCNDDSPSQNDIDGNITELFNDDDTAMRMRDQINEEVESTDVETADKLTSEYSRYYYQVCPHYRYKVYYWQWYYSYQRKRCYHLHSYWLTRCIFNFCKISYSWNIWWWNYVCYPEYRYELHPMVCVDTNGRWSKEYIRRRIPYCCSCRKMNYYTHAKPAPNRGY